MPPITRTAITRMTTIAMINRNQLEEFGAGVKYTLGDLLERTSRRLKLWRRASVAPTSPAADGGAAGRGFSGGVNVFQLGSGDRIPPRLHDRIGQRFALPWFDGLAAGGQRDEWKQH